MNKVLATLAKFLKLLINILILCRFMSVHEVVYIDTGIQQMKNVGIYVYISGIIIISYSTLI